MQTVQSTTQDSAAGFAQARVIPVVSAFLLGAFLIYGTGFLGVPAVHNAAHDQRHAIGFPCH